MDDIKKKLVRALQEHETKAKKPRKTQKAASSKTSQAITGDNNLQTAGDVIGTTKERRFRSSQNKTTTQRIRGSGNVQVGGDLNLNTVKTNLNILPPPESIGADSLLKQRIMGLFDKIGQEREKRFGKTAYSVMYGKFKRDFKIPKEQKYTIIWTWPKECAPAIIEYLEEKYAGTIRGRIENASKKPGYTHTLPHLVRMEKELWSQLGHEWNSPEVKNFLKTYYGVSSHRDLTYLQQWQIVCHLEGLVKRIYNEA